MNTIYQSCLEADIETANHCSDLYIPVTPQTTTLIAKHKIAPKSFRNKCTGTIWYEIPFCYDPWWEQRGFVFPEIKKQEILMTTQEIHVLANKQVELMQNKHLETMMSLAQDTKKEFSYDKTEGQWYWHSRTSYSCPCPKVEIEKYGPFNTFAEAVYDAVEPYLTW